MKRMKQIIKARVPLALRGGTETEPTLILLR